MICPHCTVGEISQDTGQCMLCGSSPGGKVTVDQPVVDEIGETVDKALGGQFEIGELIGRSAWSVVYLAREAGSDRDVALKVIPLQRGLHPDLARFDREAAIAAALSHSHIVSLLDFGRTRTLLWYTMEHVAGESLAHILNESGPMALDRCLTIVEQVASALDYIHRRGAVHGNVKPSNILIDAHGWVRLSDAVVMSACSGRSGPGDEQGDIGALEYAAPERFQSRAGSASVDQYALAAVAYECLKGVPPFVGDAPDEIERSHRTELPPLLSEENPNISSHVDEAIQRAMSKGAVQRFPNVLDFVSMLRGDWSPPEPALVPEGQTAAPQVVLIDQEPLDGDDDDDPSARPPRRRRFRLTRLLFVVLAVLMAESIVLWVRSRSSAPEPAPMVRPPALTVRQSSPLEIRRDSISSGTTNAGPETAASSAGGAPEAGGRATSSTEPPTPVVPSRDDPVARPAATRPARQPVRRPPATTPRIVPVPLPQQPEPIPADAGRLFINSTPWGQLYVDGELKGNTPQQDIPIAPGSHTIRVVREGFEPYSTEVTVAPGQRVRLTDIVLKPQP